MTARPVRRRRGSKRPRVRVRELRWGDFDDLVRNYWRLYDERAAGEHHGITLLGRKPTLAEEVDWFASFYRRCLTGDALSVVAEVGGHVIGQCSVSRVGRGPDAENGHVGELGILVGRGYRGRGVGRALLRAAISRARRRFEVVQLGVHADNLRAIRLYEQFGFRRVGSVPRGIRRGGKTIDHGVMALVLGRSETPRAKR